jgi:hypothetical protein
MKEKILSASRVKERNGDKVGTVKESYIVNKIKFVRVLWDGEVDVSEQYTSKSVVNYQVKKKHHVVSLKQNEDHAERERTTMDEQRWMIGTCTSFGCGGSN